MNRKFWLKLVNLVIICLFLWQVFSGIIMFFNFSEVLQDSVSGLHGYIGLMFVGTIMLHVILNWTWIRDAYLKSSKSK